MKAQDWQNSKYFGWIDTLNDGHQILTLSIHSQLDLARANNERINAQSIQESK